jgi:hypothetical protein
VSEKLVRTIPGSTSTVRIPNGSTSGASASDPDVRCSMRGWPARFGLVAAGLGVCVLPEPAAASVPAGVAVVQVDDPGWAGRVTMAVTAPGTGGDAGGVNAGSVDAGSVAAVLAALRAAAATLDRPRPAVVR